MAEGQTPHGGAQLDGPKRPGKRRHRLMWQLLLGLSLLYALPVAVAYLFGRSMLYHPTAITEDAMHEAADGTGWRVDRLEVGSGITVRGMIHPPAEPSASWLLYFGGNAQDVLSSREVLDELRAERGDGAAVFAYRGYDASGGTPEQKALIEDGKRIVDHLRDAYGVGSRRLVIIGQSLGSGVAVQLAAHLTNEGAPPAGLVLVSPFRSAARLADEMLFGVPVGWALKDPYRNEPHLDAIACPVLLMHGTRDRVVPFAHGRQLAEQLGERADFVALEGVGHNDVWTDRRSADRVRTFVERVVGAARSATDGR